MATKLMIDVKDNKNVEVRTSYPIKVNEFEKFVNGVLTESKKFFGNDTTIEQICFFVQEKKEQPKKKENGKNETNNETGK